MNRQQVKELLPIIQAYAEGKQIEIKTKEGKSWSTLEEDDIQYLDFKKCDFRINPEPKYRPFKDAQECLEEMKKHIPFGWVKDKYSFYPIEMIGTNFSKGWIKCYGIWMAPEQIFKNATFLDDTPFGVKIEEDKQ